MLRVNAGLLTGVRPRGRIGLVDSAAVPCLPLALERAGLPAFRMLSSARITLQGLVCRLASAEHGLFALVPPSLGHFRGSGMRVYQSRFEHRTMEDRTDLANFV